MKLKALFFLFCIICAGCDSNVTDPIGETDKKEYDVENDSNNSLINENTTIYYVSVSGNDESDGLSDSTALRTLSKASSLVDRKNVAILLKRGDEWMNEGLNFEDIDADSENPIIISAYGEGVNPVIKENTAVPAIHIRNCSGFVIENIDFKDNEEHIYLFYPERNGREFKRIRQCNFNGGGACITFHGDYQKDIQTGFDYNLKDVIIEECSAKYVYSFIYHPVFRNLDQMDFKSYSIHDFYVKNCDIRSTTDVGTSIRFTNGGYIDNCTFIDIFTKPVTYGSCGIILKGARNFDVKNTEVAYVRRNQHEGPDGEAIDFEGNCVDCTVTGCYMHHNAGPGMMIFYTAGANGPIKFNRRCNIINNRFHHNNQSSYHPEDCEIWIADPLKDAGNSNPSIIAGNRYTRVPGVQFYLTRKNIETNVLFSNNTEVIEDELFEWQFNGSTSGIPAEGSHNCIIAINRNENSIHLRINPGSQEGYPHFAFDDDHFQGLDVGLNIPSSEYKTATIILKNETPATKLCMEWDQDISGLYPESNKLTIDIEPNSTSFKEYSFDLSEIDAWNGLIKKFRLVWPDYVSGRGDFHIDYFRVWDVNSVVNGL